MKTTTLADDLAWWRANRDAPGPDSTALRDVLDRLRTWKTQHDADRARQRVPFLLQAWDGVFGDEDGRVAEAIEGIEAALARL